jgi:hypothetical protein
LFVVSGGRHVLYHFTTFCVTVKAEWVLVCLSVMLPVFMSLCLSGTAVHVTACYVIALPFLGRHPMSCTALLGRLVEVVCLLHEGMLGSRGMAPLILNPLAPELFFKIFAHPVFKM